MDTNSLQRLLGTVSLSILMLLAHGAVVDFCAADSGVYKYQDSSGQSHYVNDPAKIPEEYRQGAPQPHTLPTIVREKKKETGAQTPLSLPSGLSESIARMADEHAEWTSTQESEEESDLDAREAGPLVSREAVLRNAKPILIVLILLALLNMAALWVLLERGGLPGIGIIVPIYNLILLSRLAGKSGWWICWFLLPGVGGLIWSVTVNFCIAKNFGKSDMFAVGAAILPFIFFPIMAFVSE